MPFFKGQVANLFHRFKPHELGPCAVSEILVLVYHQIIFDKILVDGVWGLGILRDTSVTCGEKIFPNMTTGGFAAISCFFLNEVSRGVFLQKLEH